MENNQPALQQLLQKLRNNTASAEELALLQQWLGREAIEDELKQLWDFVPQQQPFFSEVASERMLGHILENEPAAIMPARRRSRGYRVIAVAAAVVVIATGWWLVSLKQDKPVSSAPVASTPVTSAVIPPGGNKATLTLADGNTIILDSSNYKTLSHYGAVTVVQQAGALAYQNHQRGADSVLEAYNTLSTPRAGQYKLVLADGSKVWLNAASTLRYPITFTGAERKVILTGEAYFEIAPNARQPFVVATENTQVRVLGTAFNVMAYTDEKNIQTTLVSGKVEVQTDNKPARMLEPGQQAQVIRASNTIEVHSADMEEALAWKNGLFYFNNADIRYVLRQVARWYDIDVEYAGTLPDRRFGGKIARNSSLNDIIRILELSHIHCKTENHKLIVMP
ncbi:FecR family protein [Filimonas lacunae]|uniref:FecR family protein n=1 Tax=Filimonas lacunae TaxID=477680 RepID=A0A173MP16_9BACT|nr:FecR family protein [Filimonas lacunae]BAV09415.1 anti-sigma factor [Filimonas lacunae]SIS72719.1 FecR family protein [Filimonas lacunae]